MLEDTKSAESITYDLFLLDAGISKRFVYLGKAKLLVVKNFLKCSAELAVTLTGGL